jgi:hypothetical protein
LKLRRTLVVAAAAVGTYTSVPQMCAVDPLQEAFSLRCCCLSVSESSCYHQYGSISLVLGTLPSCFAATSSCTSSSASRRRGWTRSARTTLQYSRRRGNTQMLTNCAFAYEVLTLLFCHDPFLQILLRLPSPRLNSQRLSDPKFFPDVAARLQCSHGLCLCVYCSSKTVRDAFWRFVERLLTVKERQGLLANFSSPKSRSFQNPSLNPSLI